jgi:hypothetical protein
VAGVVANVQTLDGNSRSGFFQRPIEPIPRHGLHMLVGDTDIAAMPGPGFEHGAMIAQDGRNVMPVENQNYKYVPWESIARALNLEMRGK